MAFATPFSSFDQPPCLSKDSLREFFLDSVRSFEEGVASKLTTINLPRRSFFKPERSISVEGVHPFIFVDSFGKKFREEEVRHHPPCDNLHYEVDSLVRWLRVLGVGNSQSAPKLVRRNEAGDWSLLAPMAYAKEAIIEHDIEEGRLVVSLSRDGDECNVFVPATDLDSPTTPILGKGTDM